MADRDNNTEGRDRHAAQPLGEQPGLIPEGKRQQIAEHEQQTAGPDGPDATEVGDTFKKQPPGGSPAAQG